MSPMLFNSELQKPITNHQNPITLRAVCLSILIMISPLGMAGEYAFSLNNSPSQGDLIIQLYDNANNFAKLQAPVKEQITEITSTNARYVIGDIPAGDYAIVVIYDYTSNKQLDSNFVGLPTEPIAMSNKYTPKGTPVYDRAKVHIDADQTLEQQLTLSPINSVSRFLTADFGIGTMIQSSPYKGSHTDQTQVIPAVVYSGEKLNINGPVFSYQLYNQNKVALSALGTIRIAAYQENDSIYLEGLGDRENTLMGGFALSYETLYDINLSFTATYDLLRNIKGGTSNFIIDRRFELNSIQLTPMVAANWLSSQVANYEFGVPESEAVPNQEAYELGNTLNLEAGIKGFWAINSSWGLSGYIIMERLDNEIQDSPIVSSNHLYKSFIALTYRF